jgi:hypothetical protein
VGLALSLGAVAATMRQGAISMMGPTLATVALVTVGGSSALSRDAIRQTITVCRPFRLVEIPPDGRPVHQGIAPPWAVYLGDTGLIDAAGHPAPPTSRQEALSIGLTSASAPLHPHLAPAFRAGTRWLALFGRAPVPPVNPDLPGELASFAAQLSRDLRGARIRLEEDSPDTPTAQLDESGLQLGAEHWGFAAPAFVPHDDAPPLILELKTDTPALLVTRAALTAAAHRRQLVLLVGPQHER